MNARIVLPDGFGSALQGFTVLELRVQERSAQTTRTKARTGPVAESLLYVGGVVVRREDTARTYV